VSPHLMERVDMFSGIVEKLGRVVAAESRDEGALIRIDGGWSLTEAGLGDSISVNGVCLTVSSLAGTVFGAEVSAETLRRTNLGDLRPGDSVNLERALRLSDRVGGHLVTGHVDGTGVVRGISGEGDAQRFEFDVPAEISRLLAEKGSVAVDGISLTIGKVRPESFEVHVVPYTLENTTLKTRSTGDRVNIETDIIAKYVEKILSPGGGGVTVETLRRSGFL